MNRMIRSHLKVIKSAPSDGFALVLALTLMALVTLVLLSMSVLLKVETSSASTALEQLRARESARLALMIALGELQQNAGPDQRVTARADILGEGNYAPQTKFWTGVWDTANPTTPPKWLVSGSTANPMDTQTPTMQIVGSGSVGNDTSQHVFAPIIEVLGDDTVTEELAWWIADEGTKASVANRPLNLKETRNFLERNTIDELSTRLISDQGLEELFEAYNRYTSSTASRLDRITSLSQLLGQNDFADPTKQNLSTESAYHTLTPQSFGVLANVLPDARGGLMQDLSLFPRIIGPEFEQILTRAETSAVEQSEVGDPIQAKRYFSQLRGLDDIELLTDGALADPTTPILSNFMMAFTVRSEAPVSRNPNFHLRMRFFCEFWNPYTSGIEMTDTSGQELDLELEITGLPTVTLEKTTGNQSRSNPIDLQDLLKDPSSSEDAITIRLRYDHSSEWLPGQSKNWTGIHAASATESTPAIATGASPYQSLITQNKTWMRPENTLGGSSGIDTGEPRLTGNIRHTSEDSSPLRIRIYSISDATGQRTLLTELNGIEYEPVSTRLSGYSSTHSGSTFGYHFMLRGPHLSADDPDYYRGLWLKDHDPRNPRPEFNSTWSLDNDPANNTGSAYAPVKDGITPIALPDPSEINETNSTINTVAFRRIIDRSNGSVLTGNLFNRLWQDTPLFEKIQGRPLSLASLQHLYFHNERPFKVGNSWGAEGRVNTLQWFDQYYFSGLSRADDAGEYVPEDGLPNPSLISYPFGTPSIDLSTWQTASSDDPILSKDLASKALVRNRFNLNSTSIAAWKAVLGGLRIHEWDYLDYPEDDTSDLSSLALDQETRGALFTRFSQTLSETYEAPETPAFEGSEPVAPSAFYRRGARHFDASEIEAFATQIGTRLKERGEPFLSMEDFLSTNTSADKSLLEQAIETTFAPSGRQRWDHQWETEGTRGPSSEIIDIDHFAPGFLTQADVMTAIGPMLSPRSDTFKIRARGQTYSPLGLAVASATVEATYQRTPTPIDAAATTRNSTNRRFTLISMKWLNEDEL